MVHSPRRPRHRGGLRPRADDLPRQRGCRVPRLYGGRSRAGRLRARRPRRRAQRRGRRLTSSRAIRSSCWKAQSRRLRSLRRGRACRKPRRGSPTPRPNCSGPMKSRCSRRRLTRRKAMLQVATNNLERAQSLFDKGWTTKAQLDDAIAQHDRNQAAVAEAEKRIIAAKLPGRSDMIDAAAANAEAARHALDRGREESRQAQGVRARRRHRGRGLFPPGRSGEFRAGRGRASAAAQSQGSLLRGRAGARAGFRSIRASRSVATAARPTSTPRSISSRARPSSPRR